MEQGQMEKVQKAQTKDGHQKMDVGVVEIMVEAVVEEAVVEDVVVAEDNLSI
jgi:hypothetical protein